MTFRTCLAIVLSLTLLTACGRSADDGTVQQSTAAPAAPPADAAGEARSEITPGLSYRTLKKGYGRAAEPGDTATVHYTGWLYDESAADDRGTKFDSSVDRGDPFPFQLGAGRVIKGWDEGVNGMLIGETRELRIAPELAYGERGAGGVIPPGATLLFEVELLGLEGPADSQ